MAKTNKTKNIEEKMNLVGAILKEHYKKQSIKGLILHRKLINTVIKQKRKPKITKKKKKKNEEFALL